MLRPALALSLVVAGSLAAAPAAAQRVDVVGVVADTTGAPLPGATVMLLQPADSVLVAFAASAADGAFRVRRVPAGRYVLRVTFIGHAPHAQPVAVAAGVPLDVGRIVLRAADEVLGRLVVAADRVPMVIRGDTLEYDAAAFGTPAGATVEDLLRRLPGVEVAADGRVTAQGEAVERVTVDGKEFFGTDPTVATRNLPADAVGRVQVFDKPSETAAFTGVADGAEQRTINLELRPERRVGHFGTVGGGLGGAPTAPDGTGTLFDGRASLNRFSPGTQLALLANANNVGRTAFSIQDYLAFAGGGRRGGVVGGDGVSFGPGGVSFGGADGTGGFTTSASGGLTYNREFSPRTQLQSSYLGSLVDREQTEQVREQQPLGASDDVRREQDAESESAHTQHRLRARLDHTFGEGHELEATATGTARGAALASAGVQRAFADGVLGSTAQTDNASDGRDLDASAHVVYRRRLPARRSVVAEARTSATAADATADLQTTTRRFRADTLAATDARAEVQDDRRRSATQWAKALLTQPVGGTRALQLSVEASATRERETQTVASAPGAAPDPARGSGFERTAGYARAALVYRDNREARRLTAWVDVQRTWLAGTVDGPGGVPVRRAYVDVLPSARVEFTLAESRTLELALRRQVAEPSLEQLNPVPDLRDPLRVRVGNPDLQPQVEHTLTAQYVSFDAFTQTNVFGFARAGYTTRAIVASRTVDAGLRQTERPVNAGDAWTATASLNGGTLVRPLRTRVSLGGRADVQHRLDLVNGTENPARFATTDLTLSLDNRDKDRLDLQLQLGATLRTAAYGRAPQLDRRDLTQRVTAAVGWTPTEAWELRTRLAYERFPAGVFGRARPVPLWSAELQRSFLATRLQLRLVATDLLDESVGVSYQTTGASVVETRGPTLGRHVLLGLTYRLGTGPPGGPGRR